MIPFDLLFFLREMESFFSFITQSFFQTSRIVVHGQFEQLTLYTRITYEYF